MSTSNGNKTTDPPNDLPPNDLPPAIAKAIVNSLHRAVLRTPTAHATPPTWLSFAVALDQLLAASPELQHTVEEAMARSARQALVANDAAVPSVDDFVRGLRGPEALTRGGTVVRAFWWGFHIQVSHEDLTTFLASAVPINTIIGTIGGGVPSPAAPFIALAAAFIAGALDVLRGLDRGSGIYISMSWFAPGIFIPTSV